MGNQQQPIYEPIKREKIGLAGPVGRPLKKYGLTQLPHDIPRLKLQSQMTNKHTDSIAIIKTKNNYQYGCIIGWRYILTSATEDNVTVWSGITSNLAIMSFGHVIATLHGLSVIQMDDLTLMLMCGRSSLVEYRDNNIKMCLGPSTFNYSKDEVADCLLQNTCGLTIGFVRNRQVAKINQKIINWINQVTTTDVVRVEAIRIGNQKLVFDVNDVISMHNLIQLKIPQQYLGISGCKVLRKGHFPMLLMMNISYNGIGDEGVWIIGHMDCPNLQSLNVNGNKLTEEGLRTVLRYPFLKINHLNVLQCLQYLPVSCLLRLLQRRCVLLDIDSCASIGILRFSSRICRRARFCNKIFLKTF